MATRSHTTYKKRQKELARLEKQRDKMARRMERKLRKNNPDLAEPDETAEEDEEPLAGEAVPPQDAASDATA